MTSNASSGAEPAAPLDVLHARVSLRATSSAALLRDLAEELHRRGIVTADFADALCEREQQYPTGLPTPIPTAIPHAEAAHVLTPGLVVVTLAEPVDFGEMGGEGGPVGARLVVMPLLRDAATHLRALQRLMGVLRDEAAVQDLLDAPDDDSLVERAQRQLAAVAEDRR